MNDTTTSTKKPRGFAALTPEKRREIAAMGGKAIAPEKRSFSKNRELAAAAGHKGGVSVDPAKRSFADRDLARAAGAKGGRTASARRRAAADAVGNGGQTQQTEA